MVTPEDPAPPSSPHLPQAGASGTQLSDRWFMCPDCRFEYIGAHRCPVVSEHAPTPPLPHADGKPTVPEALDILVAAAFALKRTYVRNVTFSAAPFLDLMHAMKRLRFHPEFFRSKPPRLQDQAYALVTKMSDGTWMWVTEGDLNTPHWQKRAVYAKRKHAQILAESLRKDGLTVRVVPIVRVAPASAKVDPPV